MLRVLVCLVCVGCVAQAAPSVAGCTAGYSPCILDVGADYDCGGGGGDGPYFTPIGTVYTITGADPYNLDHDDDGLGCER